MQLLHQRIDLSADITPGRRAAGLARRCQRRVVFDANVAEKAPGREKVILVRSETTPDDIHGIVAAQGVLTSRGGMTSHAAVVARGMETLCQRL